MTRSVSLSILLLVLASWNGPAPAEAPDGEPVEAGRVPTDAQGRPLNLDFETGTLADWTAEGDAFAGPADRGRHGQPPPRRHAAAGTRAGSGSAPTRRSGDHATGHADVACRSG